MGNLSEAARRRIAAVILLAGIAVGALAIADVGPFTDPPSEAERAQGAVEGFATILDAETDNAAIAGASGPG